MNCGGAAVKAWQEDASSSGSSSSINIRRSMFAMDGPWRKVAEKKDGSAVGFSKPPPHSFFSAKKLENSHCTNVTIRFAVEMTCTRKVSAPGSSVTLHRSISGMLKDFLNALLLALDPSDGGAMFNRVLGPPLTPLQSLIDASVRTAACALFYLQAKMNFGSCFVHKQTCCFQTC